jgi:hypothetical protein
MYLNTPEIQRFSLAVGALAALAWKKRQGVIPGGMIVPGLLSILLVQSIPWALSVFGVSVFIQNIYRRWIERVDHERRTAMYFLGFLSLLCATPIAIIFSSVGLLPTSIDSLSGILLPGVIAFNIHRQGFKRVVHGLTFTTAGTLALTGLFIVLGHGLLGLDFDEINKYYNHDSSVRLPAHLLLYLLALVTGFLIYRKTRCRPGGYVVAPMAAALLLDPISAVMFVGGCLVVYFFIVLMSKMTLIVGLDRYVTALLLSIAYVWGIELAFIHFGWKALPFQANHLLVIIAILSYASDAALHGPQRVLLWMLAMVGVSFSGLMFIRLIAILAG